MAADVRPYLLLAALAVLLSACASSGRATGVDSQAAAVAKCLDDRGFLVQARAATIAGSSAGGVGFTMAFYKDAVAAKEAAAGKSPKTTVLVETAVVDFQGNAPPSAGAPPARISASDLAVLRTCIERNTK